MSYIKGVFYLSGNKQGNKIGVIDAQDGVEEFYDKDFLDRLGIDIIGYNYTPNEGTFYKTEYFIYTYVKIYDSAGWNIHAIPREDNTYKCKSTFLGIPVISAEDCFSYLRNATYLDVKNMNTSNIISMENMFRNCLAIPSLDLSNFNISEVVNTNNMFSNCWELRDINLSSFNTSKLRSCDYMFSNCKNLSRLDISNFDFRSINSLTFMFSGCLSLKDLKLPIFNNDRDLQMRYMFSECKSLTSLELFGLGLVHTEEMFMLCNSLRLILTDSKAVAVEANSHNKYVIVISSRVTKVKLDNISRSEIPKLLLMGYKGIVTCDEL